ncbi:MAG TPA: hypothetical protein VME44_25935 [Streptosporangiaceae bacterium]|nr:hypothetical protein [Streptosporangiaceae bacterium]
MRDNDLRELFDKWALPMRDASPPPLSVIIKRKRRRTVRIASTCATSVAAVAVVASLVGTSLSGQRPDHHVSATPTAAPPYYLTVSASGSGSRVDVWDSVTGKRVGSVRAPVETSVAGRRYHTVFTAVAAGNDRTFVLDATVYNNTTVEMPSGLFELHLAADGSPGPLKPLKSVRLHQGRIGQWITPITSVALTADGSELAIATTTYHGEISGPSKIDVVTLATGLTRTWTAKRQAVNFDSLSWAGDSTLAFVCDGESGAAVCVLNTTGQGGRIDNSHPLIPASVSYHGLGTPLPPMITPNGSDIYAALQNGNSIRLVEFSARTGRPLRVVISAQPNYNGYCGVLWSDPSGQHLTASCTWGSLTGTISHGVFKRGRNLPPAPTAILQSGSSGTSLIAW